MISYSLVFSSLLAFIGPYLFLEEKLLHCTRLEEEAKESALSFHHAMREFIDPFKIKIYNPGTDLEANPDSMLFKLVKQRSKYDFAINKGAEWAEAYKDLVSKQKDSPYGQINHLLEFLRKRLQKEWEAYEQQFEPEVIPHAQLLGATQKEIVKLILKNQQVHLNFEKGGFLSS